MQKEKRICIICSIILLIIFLYNFLSYYKLYIREQKEKNAIHILEDRKIQQEEEKRNIRNTVITKKEPPDLISTEKNFMDEHNSNDIEEGSDVIVCITDINLEKFVYTGNNRDTHLTNYELITADEKMKYENGGNYIICGHASRLYGHSLNRIKEVKKGTMIEIKYKDSLDKYIVTSVSYPNMFDTSQYCNQTTERTLTIISCAKYISKESYIVIHANLI